MQARLCHADNEYLTYLFVKLGELGSAQSRYTRRGSKFASQRSLAHGMLIFLIASLTQAIDLQETHSELVSDLFCLGSFGQRDFVPQRHSWMTPCSLVQSLNFAWSYLREGLLAKCPKPLDALIWGGFDFEYSVWLRVTYFICCIEFIMSMFVFVLNHPLAPRPIQCSLVSFYKYIGLST